MKMRQNQKKKLEIALSMQRFLQCSEGNQEALEAEELVYSVSS